MTAGDPSVGSVVEREREALAWLFRFSDWERGVGWSRDAAPEEVWKLGRTRALLDLADAPDRTLRIVQVAGTKGKGSTVASLEGIVRAAGWRTGVYTQPHLHEYRERVRIDGQPVAPEAFADGVDRLRTLVDRFAELHPEAGAPTTFELTTVLAVLLSASAGVDLMIAEVGLGGRLDATSALDTDLAVLARIGLDHRQILGRTLAEIAGEKVAIVRPGQPVVSVRQRPPAQVVIEAYCADTGAHLRTVSALREVRANGAAGQVMGRLASGERFQARVGLAQLLEGVGEHQRQNAALAVAAAEALVPMGLPLTVKAVEQGLEAAWLPARLELVGLRPRTLIDAAHNVDSARALADELRRWRKQPIWLVLGILRDKDAAAILRELLPLADGVVVVTPMSPRALPAEQLAAACARLSDVAVERASSVGAGIDLAQQLAGADGGVAVAGSFATATEARVALGLSEIVTPDARRAWLKDDGLERD
jgi:dihydrofolate synthase/folylpolyglutamate synthase